MNYYFKEQLSSQSWFGFLKKHAIELAWVLSGILLFGLGIEQIYYGAKSVSWSSVDGVVQTSKIVKYRRRGRSHTQWKFDYTYIYDGMQYKSSRVSFALSSLSKSVSNSAKKYSKGKRVKVFFNPDDPQVAVLERGITSGGLICLLASFASISWGIGAFIFEILFFRVGLTLSTVVCMHLLSQLYIEPSQTHETMRNVEEAELASERQKALQKYKQKVRLEQMKLSGKYLISKPFMSSYKFREDGTGVFFSGLMLQFGHESFEIPFSYKQIEDELEITQVDNGAKLKATINPLSMGNLTLKDVVAEEGVNRYLSGLLKKGIILTRTEKSLAELADE